MTYTLPGAQRKKAPKYQIRRGNTMTLEELIEDIERSQEEADELSDQANDYGAAAFFDGKNTAFQICLAKLREYRENPKPKKKYLTLCKYCKHKHNEVCGLDGEPIDGIDSQECYAFEEKKST